ncbi:MAG TPA: hypothetical protein VFT27_13020 [Actinomycetota bacterium]|nr:hypothetical protein [Actinomycetota bacterium]
MPRYKTPQRRPIPRTEPPARRAPVKKGQDRSKAIRAWTLLGLGALGFLIVLWLGTKVLGGGDDGSLAATSGSTGVTGPGVIDFADPPPPGVVSKVFPEGAQGTRLLMQIVGVGPTPQVCTPEFIHLGNDVRAIYHHRCGDDEDIDRLFLLVRMTNTTDLRVPVTLDGFRVKDTSATEHDPLATPPPDTSANRFFPTDTVLGPGVEMSRWVTIDGSGGVRPERLIYSDGEETLVVRIPDDWA